MRHYIEILVHVSACECVVFTISFVHYILRIFIFGYILSTSWLVGVRVLEYSFILLIIVERV